MESKTLALLNRGGNRIMAALSVVLAAALCLIVPLGSCWQNFDVEKGSAGRALAEQAIVIAQKTDAETDDVFYEEFDYESNDDVKNEALCILADNLWADEDGSMLVFGISSYSVYENDERVISGSYDVLVAWYKKAGTEGQNVETYLVFMNIYEGTYTLELNRAIGDYPSPWKLAFTPAGVTYTQILGRGMATQNISYQFLAKPGNQAYNNGNVGRGYFL